MSLTKVSYSMINGAVANVLDFGAVGNGTTDCTSAINAAIASLGSSGGTVFFPTGRYKTTAKITITTPVRIVGTGRGTVSNVPQCEIVKSGNYTVLEFAVGSPWGGLQDIAIGTTDASFTGDGVYISGGRFDMSRVSFVDINGKAVNIYNANVSSFSNVYTFNCSIGLYVDGATPPDTNGMTFLNWDILSSRQDGIYLANCIANTFVGMTIQGSTRYAIFVNGDRNLFYGTYAENSGTAHLVYGANADYNFVQFSIAEGYTTVTNPTGTNGWSTTGAQPQLPNGIGFNWAYNPAAAGMTSKVLSDYEEGTWTPSFTSLTTSGTVTTTATYTKVGRLVHCTVSIVGTGGGTSSSFLGTTRMAGLPYAPSTNDILSAINANSLAPIGQCVVAASSYLPSWTTLTSVSITFTYQT
jgi:hypothetical protein